MAQFRTVSDVLTTGMRQQAYSKLWIFGKFCFLYTSNFIVYHHWAILEYSEKEILTKVSENNHKLIMTDVARLHNHEFNCGFLVVVIVVINVLNR